MGVFSLISNSANLRLNMMPFLLNPGAQINSHQDNSTTLKGVAPQYFSFKETSRNKGEAAFGLLNICPSSFKQFMESDIGYKLLYEYSKSQGITQNSITANAVFDALPALQIREYAIDSELDLLLNLFRDLVNVFNPGDKNAPENKVQGDSEKGQDTKGAAVNESKNIADKIKGIWEKIATELKGNGFYNKICEGFDHYVNNYSGAVDYNKIVRFPFAVYYRLLSCVTTNCYEVPIHPDIIMLSLSEGFEGADPYEVSLPGQGMIASIPIIGKVIERMMKTISINTSPVWDPSKTSKTGPTITCKFKLFNDTIDAAINNFIFVNTIGANNMWYNYSIFKRAPALYDIKIAGVYRYFMCTANVVVKPAGPVRKVPRSLLNALFGKHAGNQTKSGSTQASIKSAAKQQADSINKKANEKQKKLDDLEQKLNSVLDKIYDMYASTTEEEFSTEKFNELCDQAAEIQKKIDNAKKDVEEKQQDDLAKNAQLASEATNSTIASAASKAANEELIAIPDLYDVELSFTSMLPNNFNNFLYVYAGNPDVMRSDKGYQENVVVKFVEALKPLIL